jgi:hypothetical protein
MNLSRPAGSSRRRAAHKHDAAEFLVSDKRLARFIARKHGSWNWRRGKADLIESQTTLGLTG